LITASGCHPLPEQRDDQPSGYRRAPVQFGMAAQQEAGGGRCNVPEQQFVGMPGGQRKLCGKAQTRNRCRCPYIDFVL